MIFGLAFAGFALFWMIMAAQAGGLFWAFGLIHFSVGLGIAFAPPFWNAWRRRHTWYTLTNRRAFIATDMPVRGRRLQSYPISRDTVLAYDAQDPATIHFAHEYRRGRERLNPRRHRVRAYRGRRGRLRQGPPSSEGRRMTLLLTDARLIDPEVGTETLGAVKVSEGKITAILTQPSDIEAEMFRARNILPCGGKFLAPGIVDIGVKVCEPGERHKESFRSAGLAAAAGGVTTMVTRPDTTARHRHARSAGIRHPPRGTRPRRCASCPWPR